jgi:hypothetical protein
VPLTSAPDFSNASHHLSLYPPYAVLIELTHPR